MTEINDDEIPALEASTSQIAIDRENEDVGLEMRAHSPRMGSWRRTEPN
jgi:hypothetical protein